MAGKSLKANFVTPQQVAEGIEDGQTICTIGMTLVSASESNLKAIEERFLSTGHPATSRCCTPAASPTASAASSTSPTRASSRASSAPTGASSLAGWT